MIYGKPDCKYGEWRFSQPCTMISPRYSRKRALVVICALVCLATLLPSPTVPSSGRAPNRALNASSPAESLASSLKQKELLPRHPPPRQPTHHYLLPISTPQEFSSLPHPTSSSVLFILKTQLEKNDLLIPFVYFSSASSTLPVSTGSSSYPSLLTTTCFPASAHSLTARPSSHVEVVD